MWEPRINNYVQRTAGGNETNRRLMRTGGFNPKNSILVFVS